MLFACFCAKKNSFVHLLPVPPQIVPFDFGDEAVNSGEFASVSCSVHKGDLPIQISWYRNNGSMVEGNGITIMKNQKVSTLSIDSVSFESAGEYTCLARNRAGSISHAARLNVNGSLYIILHVLTNDLVP